MILSWLVHLTLVVLLLMSAIMVWWYYIFFSYKKYLKAYPTLSQVPVLGSATYVRNTVGRLKRLNFPLESESNSIATDIYNKLLSYSKKLGGNFFGMVGPFPVLLTADPEVFSIVLGAPKFVDNPPVYMMLENFMSNSLLLVNGKNILLPMMATRRTKTGNEWRKQRKMLNPALDYINVTQNIHVFNAKSADLVKALSDEVNKESTELDGFVETWALSQIHETMLGDTTSPKDKLNFLTAMKCVLKIAVQRTVRLNEFYNATYVFTKNYWLERKMLKIIFDHTRAVIRRTQAEIERGEVRRDRQILIDILLKQMETDVNVTETFILKQLNLMILAGFDTSGTAICFALYNLSLHPDVQEKAYDELFSLLGDDINQPITLQHVKGMKYLDLVIKESMRIKTTVPIFFRKLDEDVKYKGTILPKGLTIMLLAHVMHLDPELYPDPEKFIPERFLPENLNPNRYSYVPFAGGVRNCIGQKYANMSMKVVLAKILLNYKLVDAHHKLCLACEITLRSKTGIKVGLRRRT